VPLIRFATYAVAPFGLMAIATGPVFHGIGVPGVFVARLMVVTVSVPTTYAVALFGVMAIEFTTLAAHYDDRRRVQSRRSDDHP
jgi:F420-0:gamma-glutamyl ligase-like protein